MNDGLPQSSWRHHALPILRHCGLPEFHIHQIMLDKDYQIPSTEVASVAIADELQKCARLTERTYGTPFEVDLRSPTKEQSLLRGSSNDRILATEHRESRLSEHGRTWQQQWESSLVRHYIAGQSCIYGAPNTNVCCYPYRSCS